MRAIKSPLSPLPCLPPRVPTGDWMIRPSFRAGRESNEARMDLAKNSADGHTKSEHASGTALQRAERTERTNGPSPNSA